MLIVPNTEYTYPITCAYVKVILGKIFDACAPFYDFASPHLKIRCSGPELYIDFQSMLIGSPKDTPPKKNWAILLNTRRDKILLTCCEAKTGIEHL